MAEEKFPYLKQATALYHANPRPDNLLDALEALSDKAGGNTPEAHMIGGLISAAVMDDANKDS
ncbi:hypothetical protein [Hafnia alvei]|uniref:hypothetical protein n=1 Tax=Hafnia alvei TaxID=569 RepID=UPI0024A8F9EF|nr:hypothetical protein [Hafnia alvei]